MRGEGAGSRRRVCFRLKPQLFALAVDVVDPICTAEEPCGFLDQAAVFNFGLEVIDIHLGPVSALVIRSAAVRTTGVHPTTRQLPSLFSASLPPNGHYFTPIPLLWPLPEAFRCRFHLRGATL